MERDEVATALEEIVTAMEDQFGETQAVRVQQLKAAVATASMAVGCLYEEAEREADLIARIRDNPIDLAPVHGHQLRAGALRTGG
jgi:hypothetical protein